MPIAPDRLWAGPTRVLVTAPRGARWRTDDEVAFAIRHSRLQLGQGLSVREIGPFHLKPTDLGLDYGYACGATDRPEGLFNGSRLRNLCVGVWAVSFDVDGSCSEGSSPVKSDALGAARTAEAAGSDGDDPFDVDESCKEDPSPVKSFEFEATLLASISRRISVREEVVA